MERWIYGEGRREREEEGKRERGERGQEERMEKGKETRREVGKEERRKSVVVLLVYVVECGCPREMNKM